MIKRYKFILYVLLCTSVHADVISDKQSDYSNFLQNEIEYFQNNSNNDAFSKGNINHLKAQEKLMQRAANVMRTVGVESEQKITTNLPGIVAHFQEHLLVPKAVLFSNLPVQDQKDFIQVFVQEIKNNAGNFKEFFKMLTTQYHNSAQFAVSTFKMKEASSVVPVYDAPYLAQQAKYYMEYLKQELAHFKESDKLYQDLEHQLKIKGEVLSVATACIEAILNGVPLKNLKYSIAFFQKKLGVPQALLFSNLSIEDQDRFLKNFVKDMQKDPENFKKFFALLTTKYHDPDDFACDAVE